MMHALTHLGATPWRRLAASAIDFVCISMITFLFFYAWSVGVDAKEDELPIFSIDLKMLGPAIAIFVVSLATCWALFGTTPGLALTDCELRRFPSGESVGWMRALARAIFLVITLALGGLGFWWCFFHYRHRSLYDILSGTSIDLEDDSRLSLSELERQVCSDERQS